MTALAGVFRPGMSVAEAAATLVAEQKSPEPAATGRGEIQNQERDQIMDETTGTITAWVERGPAGERGPLWEVAVERMTPDEPWRIYATFEGYHDGEADFAEMQRCVDAGRDAERELMRLCEPDRWARGEVAARHPELSGHPRKIDAYIDSHSFPCRTRGCLQYGLWHVAEFEDQVVHTAFHLRGNGWALEATTTPGDEQWVVRHVSSGRRATGAEAQDLAAALASAKRRVKALR